MTESLGTVAHVRRCDENRYLNAAVNKVFWVSTFAGVTIALVVQLLFNLLGMGISAALVDQASNDNPSATTLSISAVVWFVVSGVIASFVGGCIASGLSGRSVRLTGALYGVASWALTSLVSVYLLTPSIGTLVGGVFSGLGSIELSAGSRVPTAATTAEHLWQLRPIP
jgi:hypothetical protein